LPSDYASTSASDKNAAGDLVDIVFFLLLSTETGDCVRVQFQTFISVC